MANKRMFSIDVVDTDKFLDMPLSAQALYFHLGMRADDDGFVSAPKKIMRSIGAQEDDLRVLITKAFVIPFESGVVVISHWNINNTLKSDRYKPTIYQTEFKEIEQENKIYKKRNQVGNNMEPERKPSGNQMEPQYSIDKYSIDKYSIDLKSAHSVDAQPDGQSPPAKNKKNRVKEVDTSITTDYFGDGKVDTAFNEFLKARKEAGTKNTERAVKLLVDKLKPYPSDIQYKAITESIMNGWKGVFPENGKSGKAEQQGTGNQFLDMMLEEQRGGGFIDT